MVFSMFFVKNALITKTTLFLMSDCIAVVPRVRNLKKSQKHKKNLPSHLKYLQLKSTNNKNSLNQTMI